MSVPTELLARVLELGPGERAELAQALLLSLEIAERTSPEEWEAAWAAEIEERVRLFESGAIDAIPADQVLAEMRAALQARSPS